MSMNYIKLKPTLMQFYNVTSTQLDNGEIRVPYSVYCVKNYFYYNGEWLAADTVKLGKSFSVANRVRTYGQSGSDVRLLWNIDCADASFATELEKHIHNEARMHHFKNTHATEMFLMDTQQAYSFLDDMEKKFNLKNNERVQRINKYSATGMHVYEVDKETATHVTMGETITPDKKFNELFGEV